MKRILITVVTLCLVFGLGTAEAKDKKQNRKAPPKDARTEKAEEMKEPRRKGDTHHLAFHSGLLNQVGYGTWSVGELNLVLKKDCVVSSEMGEDGFLREGSMAIVMGSRLGDTIVAWSVRVMGPDDTGGMNGGNGERLEPGDDPSVGVMHSGPE